MIEIIPAIDLIGGQCVRLTQGDYDRRTTYYKDPLDAARRYEDCGIRGCTWSIWTGPRPRTRST